MKYRIKELTNRLTGNNKYVVQSRHGLWWIACDKHLGWDIYVPAEYDSRDDAENHIKKMELDDAWKPTPHSNAKGELGCKLIIGLVIIGMIALLMWILIDK